MYTVIIILLILLLVVGSILVYISKFNFTPVTVNLGVYVFPNVPLFYIIITSILVGLTLSYLFNLVASISSRLALRSKNNEIKKEKAEVLELTKRIHQLELEQEKRKNGELIEVVDKNAL